MSEENVEIARRYLEEHLPAPEQLPAWVAGFWESDGDYYPARKIPAARPCHGREEIVAFLTEWPCGLGRGLPLRGQGGRGPILAMIASSCVESIRAEGRASGAALEGDTYSCFWLRNWGGSSARRAT